MTTRGQLNQERVRELITELGEAGVIHSDESDGLTATGDFGDALEVRNSTPEPPAVSRKKVTKETHNKFVESLEADNTDEALKIIWHVLTGVDVSQKEHEKL